MYQVAYSIKKTADFYRVFLKTKIKTNIRQKTNTKLKKVTVTQLSKYSMNQSSQVESTVTVNADRLTINFV